MTDRAFIAGATGATGRALIPVCRSKHIEPIAHVRPGDRYPVRKAELESLGAVVDGATWEPDAIRGALERHRPRFVFASLGTTQSKGRSARREGRAPETYETVDIALTAMLAQACSGLSIERVLLVSSAGASSNSNNAYLRARARMEDAVKESGVPYTIVRPSFILADREEERRSERSWGALADGALRIAGAVGLGSIRNRWRSITAQELATSMVELACDPRAENRIIERAELR